MPSQFRSCSGFSVGGALTSERRAEGAGMVSDRGRTSDRGSAAEIPRWGISA